jgi:hypothetical protein
MNKTGNLSIGESMDEVLALASAHGIEMAHPVEGIA